LIGGKKGHTGVKGFHLGHAWGGRFVDSVLNRLVFGVGGSVNLQLSLKATFNYSQIKNSQKSKFKI